MKQSLLRPLAVLLVSSLAVGSVSAGEKLDRLNAAVEAKAQQIDQDYGVLPTTEERTRMKITFVAVEVVAELEAKQASGDDVSITETLDEAVIDYEISDPDDQRKLLIEAETNLSGSGNGTRPSCC